MYLRRNRVLLLTLFVLCTILFYILGDFKKDTVVERKHVVFGEHECPKPRPKAKSGRKGVRKKRILFYTNIFDRIPVFYPDGLNCCEPFECEIIQDKSKILECDAVVFHGRDLPKASKMPKQRTQKQRWIFYTMENPFHSKIIARNFNYMFNWTMTYERRSDIYEPYGYYIKKADGEEYIPKNHAAEKDKFAAYINSHCQTAERLRENYIRAINKLVKVDVYGECGGIFGRITCPRNSEKCMSLLKHYKFYLAFENALCEDYVSEKYWDVSIPIGGIPVVYGGKSFKDVAIAGSYIDASTFANVNTLIEYLHYLDKNDTAYNEYFRWKKFYKKSNMEPWPCRLCRMLHNDSLPEQTYKHFDKFIDPKHVCGKDLDKFQNYIP